MEDNSFYSDLLANNPLGTTFSDYEQLKPPIPSGVPPTVPISTGIAGDYQTGPMPAAKVDSGGVSLAQSAANLLNNAQDWAYDPNAYAKSYNYAAGIKGANFERYYNHPKFRELGFSPLRDNESVYNENSTWWDDFVRMGSQWTDLAFAGFKSPYDFGAEDVSETFAKTMAVGNTTRGGVGGFFTNLALNSAFTLGIAGEMVAENFAIAGITWATGGLAAPAAGAKAALNIAETGKTIEQATEALNSTQKFVQGLQELNTAKQYFKSANEVSTGKKVWNFINPLGNTTNYLTDLYKGANGFKTMNEFVKTRKAFGAFYRDMREINLVVSESMLEGNMARNENNDKAIDAYYRQNGYMPTGKDAQDIFEKSMNVGFATSVANVPVIYFTNKLVFHDLFKGFKAPSVVGEEILAGSSRKLALNPKWKLGDNVYEALTMNAKQKTKDFLFRSPYLPWTKKYMLGNLGEGIQEWAQDVTSDSANMYYENTHGHPANAGMLSVLNAVGTALTNQFSMRGLETFASGFLMGSIVQGVSSAAFSPMNAPGLYKQYFKSGEFQELKAAKEKTENLLLGTANDLINNELGNFNTTVNSAIEINNLTDRMGQAQLDNNQKAYMDAKDEKSLANLYLLASAKRMNMVYDHLDALERMNDTELKEAFPDKGLEAQQIRSRIDQFRTLSREFQNSYDAFTERYPNPYNPEAYDEKKSPIARTQEAINKRGWDDAVRDSIIATMLYGRNVDRLKSVYDTFSNNQTIRNAQVSDFSVLLNDSELEYEIKLLGEEIDVLEQGSPEQKRDAATKLKKLEALKDFRSGKTAYENNMLKLRKIMAQKQAMSETVAVGNIFRDKETGQLVEILDVSEDGKIVGIRNENNEDFDVPREDLEPVYEDKFTEDAFADTNEKLFDIYRKYVGVVTDITNSRTYDEQNLHSSFVAMRDYFALQNESNALYNAVNALNNPEIFMQYSQRLAKMEEFRVQNFANIIKSSNTKLSKIYLNNTLLNSLFDLKIAIDPNDAPKVLKMGEYEGVVFYDAFTAEPITSEDPRYGKLQEELKKYRGALDALKAERTKKKTEEGAEEEKPETEEEIEKKYKADTEQALLDFIKAENAKRKTNGEVLLSEDLNDPATQAFINENSEAQAIIKKFEEERKKRTPEVSETEDKDWTPRKAPKGLEELAPIFAEVWKTTKDEKHYVNEKGRLATRVSYLKQDFDESLKTPAGKQRGTVMDSVLRAIIEGDLKIELDEKGLVKDESVKAIKEYMDSYIERKGYQVRFEPNTIPQFTNALIRFTTWAKARGLTLYADIPTIVDMLGKDLYGGSIDILAKDKSGKYFIIDLKTNSNKYDRRTSKKYRDADMIQLNAYADLFTQKTGIEVGGIYILNMTVEHGGPFDTAAYDKVVNIRLETDKGSRETSMEHMLIPIERKSIYELDRTIGKKRLKPAEVTVQADEYAMRYDLVNRFNRNQIDVDKMSRAEVETAYAEIISKLPPLRTFDEEFEGKIVYATPGAGKSTLVADDYRLVDMDKLLIAEMMRRQPQFTRRDGETEQEFIYRYSSTFEDKNEVNSTVLSQARLLADAGKIVLTGTIGVIPFVDIVVTIPVTNQRIIDKFGNKSKAGTFTKKEKIAVDEYEQNTKGGVIIDLEKENIEDVIYKPEAPAPAAPTTPKKGKKKGKGVDTQAAREAWFDRVNNINEFEDYEAFENEISMMLSTFNASKKYLKKHGITMDEVTKVLNDLRKGFGIDTETPSEPEIDKEAKDLKKDSIKNASDMASELEVLSQISKTKMTVDQAKKNFMDDIC